MKEPGWAVLETYNDGLVHWHAVGSGTNALCCELFGLYAQKLRFEPDGTPTCLWCFLLLGRTIL